MLIRRGYKFRLNASTAAEALSRQFDGCNRFISNKAFALQKERFNNSPLSKVRSHRECRYERSKESTKRGTLPASLSRKGCCSDRARRDCTVRPLIEAGSKVSARCIRRSALGTIGS
jgi:hypothetical protein